MKEPGRSQRGPLGFKKIPRRWVAGAVLGVLALRQVVDRPAAAQQQPLRIGALGLEPCKAPGWYCRPWDPPRPAPQSPAEGPPRDAREHRAEFL